MSDPLRQDEDVNKVWVKMEIKEEPVDVEVTFYDQSEGSDEADNDQTPAEGGTRNVEYFIEIEKCENKKLLINEKTSTKSDSATGGDETSKKQIFNKIENCDSTSSHINEEKPAKRKRKEKPEPKVPKTYKCPECSYVAAFRYALVNHIDARHKKRIFKCEYCDYNSGFSWIITQHKKKAHKEIFNKNPLPMLYTCNYCEYNTKYMRSLKFHERTEHNTYTCTICKFITTDKDLYSTHLDNHMNKNPNID